MVTIKGTFALDLLYDSRWEKYAAEAGIENPWAKYRSESIESTTIINWKEIPYKKNRLIPSDEERIAYRRQEYLWKAKIIQPKVKWEDFAVWVECREGIFLDDFCPCDSKDGQCSWVCRNFYSGCEKRKVE